MRKFTRTPAPDFLIKKWKEWGATYKRNKEQNAGHQFQWPTVGRKKINILLETNLKILTQGHCSYCDDFPIKSKADSIDHFRPKSLPAHFELVCQWENLYYSCHNCQSTKMEQYDEHLLCPDDEAYSFNKYFLYSYRTHEIEFNPSLSEDNVKRAETTRRIFGFNDPGHIAARRISLERYEMKVRLYEDIVIDDFPYRFTIE
jgi:uncharacterized protein (TIGR02646 family)